MGNGIRRSGIAALAVLLLLAAGALWAEVPFQPTELSKRVALGITEGPDPIPQMAWDFGLDRDGDGNVFRDGRPEVHYDGTTGWPQVVWAYDSGEDRDIAYANWTGTDWEMILLRATPIDETDPMIEVAPSGQIVVVWREPGFDRLGLTTKLPGADWSEPDSVSLDGGDWRRSLIIRQSSVLLVFERPAAEIGQELVLVTRSGPGLLTTQVVATRDEPGSMDPTLHSEGGVVWLDWRQSPETYGFMVLDDGGWGEVRTMIWDSTNLLEARQVIRSAVLTGQTGE